MRGFSNTINYTEFAREEKYNFVATNLPDYINATVGDINIAQPDTVDSPLYDATAGSQGGWEAQDNTDCVRYEADFTADSSMTFGLSIFFPLGSTPGIQNFFWALGDSTTPNVNDALMMTASGIIEYVKNEAGVAVNLTDPGYQGNFNVVIRYNSTKTVDIFVNNILNKFSFDPNDGFASRVRLWLLDAAQDRTYPGTVLNENYHSSDAKTDAEVKAMLRHFQKHYPILNNVANLVTLDGSTLTDTGANILTTTGA